MAAAGLWAPPELEIVSRIDPTLAGQLAALTADPGGSDWRRHDVRWVPGRSCSVTYRVDSGEQRPTFVAARLTADGWARTDYLDDAALPGLRSAADPDLVASRLSRLCKGPVRSCRIEAVRYRPGARCVLRYDVETAAGRRTLYAKAFQPEVFARLAPLAAGLADRRTVQGLVPRLAAIWSDLRILVGWSASGRSVSAVLADDRVPVEDRVELGERLGALLAQLHAQAGVAAPPWSGDDQLSSLEAAMPAVEAADAGLATRLGSLLRTLVTERPESRRLVLSHGSFRPGQVVVDEAGRLTVLDTDGLCRSDPGFDLGVALAHLRWQAMRQPQVSETLRQVEGRLLAGYQHLAGPVEREALSWWRATALLTVALRRYRRLEVDSWKLTPGLVAAAEAEITTGSTQQREEPDLCDLAHMTTVLSRALRRPAASSKRLEVRGAEVLAVATGRRSVVRYEVHGLNGTDPMPVVGKVFADVDRARLVHEQLTLLAGGPFGDRRFRVPAPMALLPRDRMVLYRHFDGVPLDRTDPARVDEGVAAAAGWLARLHSSDVALARRFSVDQEVVSTRQWAGLISSVFPELSRRAQAVADRWTAACVDPSPNTLAPIHKDFHAGHVLLGDGVCVIDVDEARMGDPAFDIAHFCGYTELIWGADASRRLTDVFLTEYSGRREAEAVIDPGYAAYTWLKIAKQSAVGSGPRRPTSDTHRRARADRALARAEAWLDE